MSDIKNKIKELREKDEYIEFWHMCCSPEYLESFKKDGCKKGIGLGGQENGFFVYDNKQSVVQRAKGVTDYKYDRTAGFMDVKTLDNDEGLFVSVKINKKDIKYPDWQFDAECSSTLHLLVSRYVNVGDEFDITFPESNITEKAKCGLNYLWDNGTLVFRMKPESDKDLGKGDDIVGSAYYSFYWQQINDYLCKNNNDYLNEYNNIMQLSIGDKKADILKYCGKEELRPNKIIHFSVNAEDGSIKEEKTVYYPVEITEGKAPLKPKKRTVDLATLKYMDSLNKNMDK